MKLWRVSSIVVGTGIAASLALFVNTPTHAAERTWTDIGTLGSYSTSAYAMNDYGVVVGNSQLYGPGYHAFVWQNGQMTDIGVSGKNSSARSINNHGHVVGNHYSSTALEYESFLWRDGQMTDLTPVLGFASVSDINDNGKIVGTQIDGDQYMPYVYDSNTGELTQLAASGNAYAINNHDQVVGSRVVNGHHRATLWSDGETHDLGVISEYAGSSARDINDNGSITGWLADEYYWTQRAFYWKDGIMQEIGPADGDNNPVAINNHDQVIGTNSVGRDFPTVFLWQNGAHEIIEMDYENRFSYAVDINNVGQIVLQANSKSYVSNASEPLPKNIQQIIADIELLLNTHQIQYTDARTLTALLEKAKEKIDKKTAACRILDITLDEVAEIQQEDRLDTSTASKLTTDLRSVRSTISC